MKLFCILKPHGTESFVLTLEFQHLGSLCVRLSHSSYCTSDFIVCAVQPLWWQRSDLFCTSARWADHKAPGWCERLSDVTYCSWWQNSLALAWLLLLQEAVSLLRFWSCVCVCVCVLYVDSDALKKQWCRWNVVKHCVWLLIYKLSAGSSDKHKRRSQFMRPILINTQLAPRCCSVRPLWPCSPHSWTARNTWSPPRLSLTC